MKSTFNSPTLSLRVHFQLCRRRCRLSDPILSHALERAVVLLGFGRLDAQHGALGHAERDVALVGGRQALAPPPPVNLRGGVARRLAEEADDAVVGDFLVLRGDRDLWRICGGGGKQPLG